jgi:hypothetical protein
VRPQRSNTDRLPYTAEDARRLAGLSYRQLHVWDSANALPDIREEERAWRGFSAYDLFFLLLCAELRRKLNLPLAKLGWLQTHMIRWIGDNRPKSASPTDLNHDLWLVTNLRTGCALAVSFPDAGVEVARLMETAPEWPVVLLDLKPLVSRYLRYEEKVLDANRTSPEKRG